jgi:DICT domain-containing protein
MQLAIRDVAEQTGIAAGTLRMWEQRYGFPTPKRTGTGYRRYPAEVVPVLRRIVDLRERGLSVPAAIEAARRDDLDTDRPSIYAAVAAGSGAAPRLLRKRTLIGLSRAIEDEAMSRAAAPVVFAAFQEERFYRSVQLRYRRLARMADAVTVFADFPAAAAGGGVLELPIGDADALGDEWAVIVDAPGYAACLLAWEPARGEGDAGALDLDRRFEAIWTIDPEVTRRASVCAARLAARADAEAGARLEAMLADRPLAVERAAPTLMALTNRIVAYLDA